MKVKNKQLFLILFLAGLLGLLGVSIYISDIKLFYYSADKDNWLSSINREVADTFDFNGYYNENQKYIDVEHYNLKFELLPEKELLIGDVTIVGKLKKPIEEIHLNFHDNFDIKSITNNGEITDYKNAGSDLTILNKDKNLNFNINIQYSGKPVDLGFGSFVFGDFNNRSAIYSLSEPNFASTWFPCNDLTTDKAMADIFITNDSSKVSVSNGILVDVKTIADKKTYHWKTLNPITTYLICIYSADYLSIKDKYVSTKGDTLDLIYYCFPEDYKSALKDMEDHPKYLKFMESAFGEYPFLNEKYGVAEFMWGSGAMEHQTITGFSYRYYSGGKIYSDVLIHELAHQWWGNAVSPKSWKDVWLNEGFAKYSEALYWEFSEGKKSLISNMQIIYGDFDDSPLYNPGPNLFSRKVYNKGAWLLHMLRYELGDDLFFQILKSYYNRFKFKNASSIDFQNICEQVSGKDLDKFFDQWLFNGTGIISLQYSWEWNNNKEIKLYIKQNQDGYENYHFPLGLLIKDGENEEMKNLYITSKDTIITIESSFKPNKIKLDPDSWLLAHIWEEKE